MEQDHGGERGRSGSVVSRYERPRSDRAASPSSSSVGATPPEKDKSARGSGTASGPGPKASLALLVGALVTVVALGSGLVVPGHPGATAIGPSVTPLPSVTGHAAKTPIETPHPPATMGAPFSMPPDPTPPPGVILESDHILADLAWSPKGDRLAVIDIPPTEAPRAKIVDRTGKIEDEFPAQAFAWLDDDTYVALTAADKATASGAPSLVVFTGTVGIAGRQEIEGGYWAIVPGPSEAALRLDLPAGDRYVVMTRAGISGVRDGVPLAFSPDGSMMAVAHDAATSVGSTPPKLMVSAGPPTLEIVGTDTGESLATSDEIDTVGATSVAFSPDGSRVAFMMSPASDSVGGAAGVLEIATGKRWVVQGTSAGEPSDSLGAPFLWTSDSSLVVRAWTSGSAPNGIPVSVSYGNVVAAVSSTGVLATLSDDASAVIVHGPKRLTLFALPSSVWNHEVLSATDLVWSPDGTALAVLCEDSAFWPGTDELVLISPGTGAAVGTEGA